MDWEKNSDKKMYIPEFTENKEIKNYIKLLCSRRGENKPLEMKFYEVFHPFPEDSSHYLIVSTFDQYNVDLDGSYVRWTEFQMMHFIKENTYIDGVEAKLKANNSIYFKYNRSNHEKSSPELWEKEPYYLDSSKINWNKFAEDLKLMVVKLL